MRGGLSRISTAHMDHDEWLALRRRAIGGSDAAAIVGLSDYSSPYAVWAEKTGKLPPSQDNEAMRQGRDLEQYVAERFCAETGKKVRRENNILYNTQFPFAHANVDRMVIGENAGLECKTTSANNLNRYGENEYSSSYYVQCMHYMMVTGMQRWYLAVLYLGRAFRVFVVERDDAEIAALAKSEQEFWELVKTGQPPMADGNASTSGAIRTIYPGSEADTQCDLSGLESTVRQYITLGEQISKLAALREEHCNRVKAIMKEAEKGFCGGYGVSWKTGAAGKRRFIVTEKEL